jgi:hypothetical protein
MAKARAQGTRTGKAIGGPEVPAEKIAAARAALAAGDGIRKVAKLVGVGNGTVHEIVRDMRGSHNRVDLLTRRAIAVGDLQARPMLPRRLAAKHFTVAINAARNEGCGGAHLRGLTKRLMGRWMMG